MALEPGPSGKLVSVIGDEETCVGFLMGGIGEIDKNREANFMVVERDTPVSKIEECFTKFLKRDDIYVILINQHIAEMIRHLIESHTAPLPAVVEMPSKGIPYDSNKDSIMKRARKRFNLDEIF